MFRSLELGKAGCQRGPDFVKSGSLKHGPLPEILGIAVYCAFFLGKPSWKFIRAAYDDHLEPFIANTPNPYDKLVSSVAYTGLELEDIKDPEDGSKAVVDGYESLTS